MKQPTISKALSYLAQAGIGINEASVFVIADGIKAKRAAEQTGQNPRCVAVRLSMLANKGFLLYDRAAKVYRHTPKGRNLMTKL